MIRKVITDRFWWHGRRERGSVQWWIHQHKGRSIFSGQACWRKPVYMFGGHIDVDQDGEGPINLGVYLWPFSLYLNFETRWAQWVAERLTKAGAYEDRSLAFHVCRSDGSAMDMPGRLRWNLWTPDSMWSSETPRWRNGSFSWSDALFGQVDYSGEDIETVDVLVPMPEGTYAGTVKVFESTWRRRRFPFLRQTMRRTEISVPDGIPFPGKGENAWDMDDSATYSLTSPAKTPDEAVGALVASVLRDRRRYGGRNWQPEKTRGTA